MGEKVKNSVNQTIDALLSKSDVVLTHGVSCRMPEREKVVDALKLVKSIIFPNFFFPKKSIAAKTVTQVF